MTRSERVVYDVLYDRARHNSTKVMTSELLTETRMKLSTFNVMIKRLRDKKLINVIRNNHGLFYIISVRELSVNDKG